MLMAPDNQIHPLGQLLGMHTVLIGGPNATFFAFEPVLVDDQYAHSLLLFLWFLEDQGFVLEQFVQFMVFYVTHSVDGQAGGQFVLLEDQGFYHYLLVCLVEQG